MANSGRVTTNAVCVSRNDDVLAKKYAVFRYKVDRQSWKDSMETVRRASGCGEAFSVCMLGDGHMYALAPAGCARRDCVVETQEGRLSPARMEWKDVPDLVLARLMLNSCCDFERAYGMAPSDTGRYFTIVRERKNDIVALELLFEPRGDALALVPKVRTFTKVKHLLKYAAKSEKEQKKIERAPKFARSMLGTMRAAQPGDEEYAIRRPRGAKTKNNVGMYSFSTDEKYISQAKLSAIDRAMKVLARRFGDVARFDWVELPLESRREVEFSEKLRASVKKSCAGRRIEVQTVDASLASLADDLARRITESMADYDIVAVTSPSATQGESSWLVSLVPDEIEANDGYAANVGRPVQHVTATLAKAIAAGDANSELGGILKELLVKNDIASGRLSAFDWCAFGIDSLQCAKLCLKRVKHGADDEIEPQLVSLSVDDDGALAFDSIPEADAELDDELDSLCDALRDKEGEIVAGALSIRVSCGDKEMLAVVRDTGLMTIPNELDAMLDALRDGQYVRGIKNGMLGRFLSPIVNIGVFRWDGSPCYYVGHARNLPNSIKKATRIRRIDIVEGEDLTDKVVELANLGLSRYGQPSVVPIFSKYLDEYAAGLFKESFEPLAEEEYDEVDSD